MYFEKKWLCEKDFNQRMKIDCEQQWKWTCYRSCQKHESKALYKAEVTKFLTDHRLMKYGFILNCVKNQEKF